jgi:hypothetical protein
MYLTGGATAVLEGWRNSTVDIDVRFEPDSDADRRPRRQRLGVVRGTKDLDIVVAPDSENFERIAAVAVAVHGHVHTGESLLSSAPSIAGQLASGDRIAIETELGLVGVVQGLDGVPIFEELRARAAETEIRPISRISKPPVISSTMSRSPR